MSEYIFNIADWIVKLTFEKEDAENGLHIIPSFSTFLILTSVIFIIRAPFLSLYLVKRPCCKNIPSVFTKRISDCSQIRF